MSRNSIIGLSVILFAMALLWFTGIATTKKEHVLVRNSGVKLAATLTTPRWSSGPFPAVVIVHGSGRVRRENLRGFASKLVPRGVAVLMFDKRGVGKSTGVFTSLTTANSSIRIEELSSDVSAAVEFLASHPDIDASRIGLIGNSQAGWIMPKVAASNHDVSYFILLSGPAVTFGQEAFYSQLTGDDPGPYGDLSDEVIAERLAGFGGPHGFDPKPFLQDLRVPSLWILGEKDRSAPTAKSVEILEMLSPGSESLFEVRVIDDADHDLRNVETGSEYDYWSTIVDWMHRHDFLDY